MFEFLLSFYTGLSAIDKFRTLPGVSGDIGYYDENGNFFITGRLKELIKYKALQVSGKQVPKPQLV